ncbi:metallopeptidase family protein [Catenulispora pinisilvae]|uniref:metallopeptidase family protein n=1 Tax=Catenulispora pinisilvae TaxID=2705253 RepID=UPI001890EF29|nr:metallopeptidase family protein [Catenulispora pinisilvae]
MIEVSPEQFEELVGEGLDSIPETLGRQIRNVAVVVEAEAPYPGLLGLYQGIPLTGRGEWYSGVLPDRITIYRNEILKICHSYEDVVREVRATVIHEVGHHFGIDDERLHELGW